MTKDDSPFFLSINHVVNRQYYYAWLKESPMGINTIYSLTSKMVNACPTILGERKLTNHSARKHLIQKLQDKGVENAQIMQISGHKNVSSINSYSRLNEGQQRQISDVLNDTTGKTQYRLALHTTAHENAIVTPTTSTVSHPSCSQTIAPVSTQMGQDTY
ncbi:unnamed protein product [Mytilus coruscus]|uniref:Tyr recombinase domain-containing protein n=1 Tax=Mytilus coruscus TaxID=42192 RepID=A0A6J8DK10_MYTCO|nr:unnamed protein product [Mytilus coruscus]